MQKFIYKGRNKKGELIEGIIESQNKDNAAHALRDDGIVPISIEEHVEEQDVLELLAKLFKINFKMPTLTDLILFSRQMHSLLRAGVPIVKAIDVVTDSVNNEKFENALKDIVVKLESGQSLSMGMHKHSDMFPTLMVSLIDVGESTGNLDEVFSQIALHLEREYETKRRIKSAMRYPIMVIVTIFVAVGIINLLVVPAFANFFSKFGTDLPLPTRILIASSNFTINYWYVVLMTIVAGVVSWIMFVRTDYGELWWDQHKLKIPLVGTIVEKALLARFSRSFSLTSRTGVPLLESIAIIAKTTDNVYVGSKILSMKNHIERGESLIHSATVCQMFSPLVLQMISIGEETGEVDKLLDEIADYYEEELEYQLKSLSEAIEPILISIVAVMVLILALGVFLPMWSIAEVALTKK